VATKPNFLKFLNFGLWSFTDRLRGEARLWLCRTHTLYIYGVPVVRCTVLEARSLAVETEALPRKKCLCLPNKAFAKENVPLFCQQRLCSENMAHYFSGRGSAAKKKPQFFQQGLCFGDNALFSTLQALQPV
jgi:hypothetical protein